MRGSKKSPLVAMALALISFGKMSDEEKGHVAAIKAEIEAASGTKRKKRKYTRRAGKDKPVKAAAPEKVKKGKAKVAARAAVRPAARPAARPAGVVVKRKPKPVDALEPVEEDID